MAFLVSMAILASIFAVGMVFGPAAGAKMFLACAATYMALLAVLTIMLDGDQTTSGKKGLRSPRDNDLDLRKPQPISLAERFPYNPEVPGSVSNLSSSHGPFL